MARKPVAWTWADDLEQAFKTLRLAETFADDGAFLTAADRAEAAAKLFRSAYEGRLAAIEAATTKRPKTEDAA